MESVQGDYYLPCFLGIVASRGVAYACLNVLACVTALLLALYLPGSGIRDVACHVLLRFS